MSSPPPISLSHPCYLAHGSSITPSSFSPRSPLATLLSSIIDAGSSVAKQDCSSRKQDCACVLTCKVGVLAGQCLSLALRDHSLRLGAQNGCVAAPEVFRTPLSLCFFSFIARPIFVFSKQHGRLRLRFWLRALYWLDTRCAEESNAKASVPGAKRADELMSGPVFMVDAGVINDVLNIVFPEDFPESNKNNNRRCAPSRTAACPRTNGTRTAAFCI
eukprot:2954976-Rhodomonas_salina.2